MLALLTGIAISLSSQVAAQTQAACTAYLASNPNPADIPSVSGAGVAHRSAFLADGGKLVAIGSRYYTVSIPSKFYTATTPVVVFNLHGTGGYPEAGWSDWHASMADRGYAFISLAWGGGTPSAATDTEIYTQIKQIFQDVGASCPIASARKWLMGFSVGSAMSFAVMIRDVADQKIFRGQIAVSGAAIGPLTTGKDVMHSTVEANRANVNAMLGIESWMYCGEMDLDHVWSMCLEMPNGESFVNDHGGQAVLYKDPSGTHHSLPTNTAARNEMLDYLASTSNGEWAIEFYNSGINHYFMTAYTDEATSLDNKPEWGWARTGKAFNVWLTQASAPGNASLVCRFYGVFSNGTVGSHFYTVDATECAYVKSRLDWGWGYEGDAFYAVKPTGGTCPAGTFPIYRAYNNGMGGAPNHRYMTSQTEVNTMISQGWSNEDIVMCSPSSSLSPPTGVAVTNVSSQSVGSSTFSSSTRLTVTWVKPSDYTVDHYAISASETVGNTSLSYSAASTATSATLTGLKAATSYSVAVFACKDATCTAAGSATAVTGTTSEEYWQLQGSGNSTGGLSRIVSDGNVRISATRFGSDAGTSTANRIQLYYGPNGQVSQLQALSTALTGSAVSAASPASYLSFTSSGATTGLISPSAAATMVKTVATGQGVPLSAALGGKVRLFFEATGADNKTRIFTIDSQDGYVGQDFNSGSAKTCSTTADYSTGGGCALTLAVGVEGEGDGSTANNKISNARQHKVGFPTLTDWRWDGTPGTFMVFTTDSVSGCSSYNMNHGYAVWDGSKWAVQYETGGCPRLFKSVQAAFPLHIGGSGYKLYYSDPSVTTGKLTGHNPFLGPKKLIYGDGTLTGQTDRVDFEDWENQSVARDVVFLWPNGDRLDNTAEGYIDDYHFLTPTASLDLQVMYLAINNGTEIPFAAAALLQNP